MPPSLQTLKPLIGEEPRDFAALQVTLEKFIDAWLAAGGEPTDDEVVGFYSLWTQLLDARGCDEMEYFSWAQPFFVRYRDELGSLIERA